MIEWTYVLAFKMHGQRYTHIYIDTDAVLLHYRTTVLPQSFAKLLQEGEIANCLIETGMWPVRLPKRRFSNIHYELHPKSCSEWIG